MFGEPVGRERKWRLGYGGSVRKGVADVSRAASLLSEVGRSPGNAEVAN